MSALRTSMSGILAQVMLITSVLNVVLVQCSAGAGHHEVELVGHQLEVRPCTGGPEGSTDCDHDHHPEDCFDSSLLDDASFQRSMGADQPTAAVAAVLPPPAAPILNPIQPRSQLQLCPRPPPRLRGAIDDLATIRLLI